MKIKAVLDALERFAPLPLQEGFDNAGLQVGLTEAEVSGALLCLDVTEAIVDEAIAEGCNLIVAHHPLVFHKLARIAGEDYVQRTVAKAIKSDITIVAMHTNLDEAEGGVNYKIAQKIGLERVKFLGAVKEVTVSNPSPAKVVRGGVAIMGELPNPMDAETFVRLLKQRFGVACVQANELLSRKIKRVALCGGAGAEFKDLAVEADADAFVTGEIRYHEFFGYEQVIQLCAIGHYQSERFTMEIFREIIEQDCPTVRCVMTKQCTNPIHYL